MKQGSELFKLSSQCCMWHPHYVEVSLFTTKEIDFAWREYQKNMLSLLSHIIKNLCMVFYPLKESVPYHVEGYTYKLISKIFNSNKTSCLTLCNCFRGVFIQNCNGCILFLFAQLQVCDTLSDTNLATLLRDSALNYMIQYRLRGVEEMS